MALSLSKKRGSDVGKETAVKAAKKQVGFCKCSACGETSKDWGHWARTETPPTTPNIKQLVDVWFSSCCSKDMGMS
eukprot:6463501-Amphidinium_carterae.1